MRNYKKSVAWQRADDLVFEIYRVTRNFPNEELYGITSQIRRAAISIPSNIAEGAGRETDADYARFLCIARGSLNETEYFLYLSKRLGYLSNSEYEKLQELVNR
ncbi:four helix bundle protein, partial [Candidatus Poribacteria bacterium]|nr:four helix bundle protein [Candidatus Poribacteria bacterium]